MDSRQQFEESMRTKQKFEDGDFRIVSNGRYYWGTTQFAWEVWSESRESLVVELPAVHRDVTFDDESIDLMWPDEVIKAIHAAGIRTK